MPSYILAGLYAASFILPTLFASFAAVYGTATRRYCWLTAGIMVGIDVNVALGYYSYTTQPQWWADGTSSVLLILLAYFFIFIVANALGISGAWLFAEGIDEEKKIERLNL